jgi:hypothetical protein
VAIVSEAFKDHVRHLVEHRRYSLNTCPECNADRERRFVDRQPFAYKHVHEYLEYVRPRLVAIRQGEDSVDARRWLRDFHKAMHRRISSHAAGIGRKWSDGYLERLGQFCPQPQRSTRADAAYLRRFAQRGASCLDA